MKKKDCYSLREAAAVVSGALKQAQRGNGSITAQGLRKWILAGRSPYDLDMAQTFGDWAQFPKDLEKRALDEWAHRLEVIYTERQRLEALGWPRREYANKLPRVVFKILDDFQYACKPKGRGTFSFWKMEVVRWLQREAMAGGEL